jgi:hypothetical protein
MCLPKFIVQWEKFQTEVVEKSEHTFYVHFSENSTVHEKMWTNMVLYQTCNRWRYNMARAFCMLVTKPTDTHSEYVTLIDFPQQKLCERVQISCYMYNALLVIYLSQSANSNNVLPLNKHFMDLFSSLVPDSKRYTDLVGRTVLVRARRFAWGTLRHTLLHRLDLKVSSSDRIPVTEPRFSMYILMMFGTSQFIITLKLQPKFHKFLFLFSYYLWLP